MGCFSEKNEVSWWGRWSKLFIRNVEIFWVFFLLSNHWQTILKLAIERILLIGRSSISPRKKLSSNQHIHKQACIKCSKWQQKGIREKHRICETPRPQKFLKAVTRIQHEVYVQVPDLVTESRIFGADIYYYKFRLES